MTDKRTIIISGPKPTYQLFDGLGKHFTVAVYDQNAAAQLSAQRGGVGVMCPLNGAGPPLFAKARNDTAWLAADVAMNLPPENGSLPPAHFDDWLPGAALGHLSDVLMRLRVLDAFAETTQVVGIVTHEDVTPNFKALALWGKAKGVPVIHMPHGNCFAQVRPDIHDESVADWILATSRYMRDWYAERGFPKRRIRVVGFPSWDVWASDLPDRAFARRMYHLDGNDAPTLAFCTQWPQRTNLVDDHDVLEAAAHVTLAAAKREGWNVIWSIHPGDMRGREEEYAKLAAGYRVPAMVTRDHLAVTLSACDAVLSAGPSNVLVEAGLADRPVALFNLRGYGFDGEPPWKVELSVDSVASVVGPLMAGERWGAARDGFVKQYAYRNDGKATARAVRLVTRIIKQGMDDGAGD